MLSRIHALCFAGSVMIATSLVQAEPSETFMVSATITPGCLINNAIPAENAQVGTLGSLAFGTHSALSEDTLNTVLLTSNSFTLSCTPGVPLSMRINGGLQSVGRQLKRVNGTDTLAYQLYQEAGAVNLIGINTPISIDTNTSPNNITLPAWGRLTLPGILPAGTYRDELVLTLEW